MELQSRSNNGDIDSSCSSPYISAPSSPGRGPIGVGGFFYSAPASPMHFTITGGSTYSPSSCLEKKASCDFEFSARFGSTGSNGSGWMSSADELFLNGQIRPMKLSSHLERPQALAPLVDLQEEEEEEVEGRDLRLRDKSVRRRTRSLSPLRKKTALEWRREKEDDVVVMMMNEDKKENVLSSGSGRNSKRWVLLMRDFLRSKSEGRGAVRAHNQGGNGLHKPNKPTKVAGKRRVSESPHELHYKANRAQAEELRRKTYLPYKQGLLGCLGFSSKGYGAISGFTRALNPLSSSMNLMEFKCDGNGNL